MLSLLSASNPGCSLLGKTQFFEIVLQVITGSFQKRSSQKSKLARLNEKVVSYMSENPNVARRKFISMT